MTDETFDYVFKNDPYLTRAQIREVLKDDARPDGKNAFYGDASIKQHFVDRAQKHRAADDIEHGVYWNAYSKTGWNLGCESTGLNDPANNPDYEKHRGCAVGCLSHAEFQAHDVLARMTGVPAEIYFLTDTLFESYNEFANGSLDNWDKKLPEDVVSAIPVGADLSDMPLRIAQRIHAELCADHEITDKILDPDLTDADRRRMLLDHYYESRMDTGFWSEFVYSYNALKVREILLDELSKAPVPEQTVVETPQLVTDLVNQIVYATVPV